MILFSGSVNPELAEEIAKYLNVNARQHQAREVRQRRDLRPLPGVASAAPTCSSSSRCARAEAFDVNDALMELLIMADAAKRASARSIVGGHRALRLRPSGPQGRPARAHHGQARGRSARRSSGVDNVITVDLHQDAIQGFFDIPVNHMTAMPIFVDYFQQQGLRPRAAVRGVARRGPREGGEEVLHDAGLRHRHHAQGSPEAQPGRDHGAYRRRDRQGLHPERRHDRHGRLAGGRGRHAQGQGRRARCTPAPPTACSAARRTSASRTPASRKWW